MIISKDDTFWDEVLGRTQRVLGDVGVSELTTYRAVYDSAAVKALTSTALLDPGMIPAPAGMGQAAAMIANAGGAIRAATIKIATSIGYAIDGAAGEIAKAVRLDTVFEMQKIAGALKSGEISLENATDSMWLSAGRGLLNVAAEIPVVGFVVGIGKAISGIATVAYDATRSDSGRASLPFVGSDYSDQAAVMQIIEAVGERDATRIFMPRHAGSFVLSPRADEAFYGAALFRSTDAGSQVPTAANGMGATPMGRMTGVLEIRFPQSWRAIGAGDPARLFWRIRCTSNGKSCGTRKSKFSGHMDCRQCLDPWDGRDQALMSAGARPLIVDTGAAYTSATATAAHVWANAMVMSPGMWAISAVDVADAWIRYEESMLEYLRFAWEKWDSPGMRLLLAQVAAEILVRQHSIGDQWLPATKEMLGKKTIDEAFAADGRQISMTIFGKAAQDATALARHQTTGLRTTAIAMAKRDDGAFRGRREVHDKAFADLLTSPLRFAVHMADVPDKEKREALAAAGVKSLAARPAVNVAKAGSDVQVGTAFRGTNVVLIGGGPVKPQRMAQQGSASWWSPTERDRPPAQSTAKAGVAIGLAAVGLGATAYYFYRKSQERA